MLIFPVNDKDEMTEGKSKREACWLECRILSTSTETGFNDVAATTSLITRRIKIPRHCFGAMSLHNLSQLAMHNTSKLGKSVAELVNPS